ncbi:hypothetical protein ABH920_007641 [Catenulispora sp. EB89]|uniref:nuclear transport factor 2 family protein n=1 Tax=Catenulispora sp. EB89 TaxID=3156257 RepID=UPI0035111DAC
MSQTIEDLIRTYFEAWSERDARRREAVLERVFSPDAEIIDPDWTATGHAEIVSAVGEAREKLGELDLSLAKVISVHHDVALFSWELTQPGSLTVPVATGYGTVIAADGHIRRAYNFFG